MDLFSQSIQENHNLLPYDGTVNYFGQVFDLPLADHYYEVLMHSIEWKNDEAFVMGKHIITKRKVAWYGDESYPYTYSNTTKVALPWTTALLELKKVVEEKTDSIYNSCLLNLYNNGSEGMAYHSDDEKTLAKHSPIASLSFGAERRFLFKHKQTKETITTHLSHGSLLLMKDETQVNWLHRLPTTTKILKPRINLTFRQMLV